MAAPSIFLSHDHRDKPFVRRVAADLASVGIMVWVDKAELRVGDSLLSSIASAIDEMDYLAVVLSPSAVSSAWFENELEQAMTTQLAEKSVRVLPLLYQACEIPAFLRGKFYADFTEPFNYEAAIQLICKSVGLVDAGAGGRLYDPYARRFARHDGLFSRPNTWFCIACGTGPMPSYNDYVCTSCSALRPFMGGSCTMIQCRTCKQMNLLVASFCEWCGTTVK